MAYPPRFLRKGPRGLGRAARPEPRCGLAPAQAVSTAGPAAPGPRPSPAPWQLVQPVAGSLPPCDGGTPRRLRNVYRHNRPFPRVPLSRAGGARGTYGPFGANGGRVGAVTRVGPVVPIRRMGLSIPIPRKRVPAWEPLSSPSKRRRPQTCLAATLPLDNEPEPRRNEPDGPSRPAHRLSEKFVVTAFMRSSARQRPPSRSQTR